MEKTIHKLNFGYNIKADEEKNVLEFPQQINIILGEKYVRIS